MVFFRILSLISILASSTALACTRGEYCIDESSWQLGIALGVGVKTNPLVDGDDIPLVLLPDIAWYAEKAYFDNGELGYQWLSQQKFSFETFINLEREGAYFRFLQPANFLVPSNGSTNSVAPDKPDSSDIVDSPDNEIINTERSFSIDDVASRKWAINGGIRGHYFLSNGEWQLSFQQDISNVHQGQQAGVQYKHRWLWHDFRFGISLGVDWKSARLIDYYYGVSVRDTELKELHFKGEAGWQPYISLQAQQPINENWSWLANIGYRRLPQSLTGSPLVEKNNILNAFLGVAYRFD